MTNQNLKDENLTEAEQSFADPPHIEEVDSSAQSVTSAPTLHMYAKFQSMQTNQFSMEYQMTIQTKVERLTRKQASILTTVCALRALTEGIDPSLYMVSEWLLNFLTKSTKQPWELWNVHEQRAAMLITTILSYTRGQWLTLSGREKLPEHMKLELISTGWFPERRTLMSWKEVYDVGKFFQVRIVPLDILIEDRSSDTERYSGYTKGYGNGGHRSPTLKTPFDSELDGEKTDRDPAEIPLTDFEKYNRLLLLIESEKIRKQKEN